MEGLDQKEHIAKKATDEYIPVKASTIIQDFRSLKGTRIIV
jgi:hypothetical protein